MTSHLFLLLSCSLFLFHDCSASSSSTGMILRVRMGDGSMERLQIPAGAEDTMTLTQALSSLGKDDETSSSSFQIGSSLFKDGSESISSLGLKNGSMITIVPEKKKSAEKKSEPRSTVSDRFDPFPDLAKDYHKALRRTKTRRGSQGGMSYGSLADLQSSLHVVEAQPEGPLKRCYMCRVSAERFQTNCHVKNKKEKKIEIKNRVALLLGNVHRERVDTKLKKTRTSLSTLPSDREYCDVVKIQALWEPPQKPASKTYDASTLKLWNKDASIKRVLEVASMLGLRPVGWIFSYSDPHHEKDDSLPVWGPDVVTGATLQIANMKYYNPEDINDGSKYVTFAMDANTGATEAFQLSDVSVQMVAEGLLGEDEGRFVPTGHAILVDGKETTQLDSVLCLVNTAMLSHEGSYAGSSVNALKKNGSLTAKSKKRILAALDKNDDDCSLLNVLSDFNILMGLDQLINPEDMAELCRLVRKWARGQKRGTFVGPKLKVVLRSVLES